MVEHDFPERVFITSNYSDGEEGTLTVERNADLLRDDGSPVAVYALVVISRAHSLRRPSRRAVEDDPNVG